MAMLVDPTARAERPRCRFWPLDCSTIQQRAADGCLRTQGPLVTAIAHGVSAAFGGDPKARYQAYEQMLEATEILDETLEVRNFQSIAATVKADLSTSEMSRTTLRGVAKLEPSGFVSL
jgi:hypothetical protein